MISFIIFGVIAVIAIIGLLTAFTTVQQGSIAVTEVFGKYKRILNPGLSFKIPFIESIYDEISTQNQSSELEFQAITSDQANVHFKAMILFKVKDSTEETIKKVAYTFIDEEDFEIALTKTIESSIRSQVATKKQSEVLGMRSEIVTYVKNHVDAPLEDWGYHLLDVQINDITFDNIIIESMAKVVAAKNLKEAAENEGNALKIKMMKEAEAEAESSETRSKGEKNSMIIRTQGIVESRKMVEENAKNLDQNVMKLLIMDKYFDTMKHVAENSEGKVIFMDTGASELHKILANLGPEE